MDACGPTAARGFVDVFDPFYHQRICRCPWSVLPEAMLMSMGQAATRTMSGFMVLLGAWHVDVHSSCNHWSPCRCSWSMLPPGAMLMPVGQATSGGHTGVRGPCCPGDHVDIFGLC